MNDELQLLTAQQVKDLLCISQPTMWRRVKDGTIPSPVLIGGLKRWKRTDIRKMIDPPKPATRKRKRLRAA